MFNTIVLYWTNSNLILKDEFAYLALVIGVKHDGKKYARPYSLFEKYPVLLKIFQDQHVELNTNKPTDNMKQFNNWFTESKKNVTLTKNITYIVRILIMYILKKVRDEQLLSSIFINLIII